MDPRITTGDHAGVAQIVCTDREVQPGLLSGPGRTGSIFKRQVHRPRRARMFSNSRYGRVEAYWESGDARLVHNLHRPGWCRVR